MHQILEWLVYFAECTNWHIKNESSEGWLDRQSLQEILWEKQRAETLRNQPSKLILTNGALGGEFHAFLFCLL